MTERPATPRSATRPAGLPIGVTLGTVGVDARWWLDAARRLDEAGYAAIWAWDHFVGKGDRRVPVLEAMTILTAAAAVTREVRIGSFVLNVMNRHPAVVARMASTLQAISGGRFVLGMGIGGHPREHEAYGIDFPPASERAARLEEAIAVIRALWTGGPVDLAGTYYRLADAIAEPRPEPPAPIIVGAQTPAGVRLAARAADGWAAEMPFFDQLAPLYLEALAEEGRDRAAQLVILGFNAGRSGEEALLDSPWIDAPRETWEEWRNRGVDEVSVTARTTTDVDALVRAAERW